MDRDPKGAILKTKEFVGFELRSERVSLFESTIKIGLQVGDKDFKVLNISESGLACEGEGIFPEGATLENIHVHLINGGDLYRGNVQVVWRQTVDGRVRYGMAFKPEYLPENLLAALDAANTVCNDIQAEQKQLQKVPGEFLQYVLELKNYMSSLKSKVDELERRTSILSDSSKMSFAMAIEMIVGRDAIPRLVEFGKRANELARAFPSKEVYQEAKALFRRELHVFYKEAAFVERAWTKPLGYAGDYEMMNQIYRDEFEGRTLFARLIHKWGINEPSSRSVRYRRGYLKNKIIDYAANKDKFVVGSLASGPAREIVDFLETVSEAESKKFTFILMDQDKEALINAKRNIVDVILKRQLSTEVIYVPVSVKQVIEGSDVTEGLSNIGFDLIYTAGLYDYLTQDVAKFLTKEILTWVRPGGNLIVGNFHPNNPSHTIGDFAGEWPLILRTEEDMLDLLPNDGVRKNLHFDDQKIDLFLEVHKTR